MLRRRLSMGGCLAAALAVSCVLLTGCGSRANQIATTAQRPAVCKLKAQQAIAKVLDQAAAKIGYAKSVGSNGMQQCSFNARAHGHRLLVLVNVDNGPQAYSRLLRTVDEATQIFGVPPPGFHAPQGLSGLGPFAAWFPDRHQLMATNLVDLLTVTVTWPGAGRNVEVAVARAAVVPYLANPKGKGSAIDYP